MWKCYDFCIGSFVVVYNGFFYNEIFLIVILFFNICSLEGFYELDGVIV